MKKILILCLFLFIAGAATAQDNPTVAIVLSQPVAEQGTMIAAEVHIRGAQNVGGADVGVTVDSTCLRIVDRQPGTYLPTSETEGAFVPLTEVNDHDTRLAVALTNRSRAASGDGVFYTIQLEVLCDAGTAPLTIAYAKLSTYEDPAAESVSLISYSLEEGTLEVVDAELMMVPPGQATIVPTVTPLPTVGQEQPTATSPSIPTATPLPADSELEQTDTTQTLFLAVIGLLISLIVILLGVVFWLWRRTRESQVR